MFLIYHIYLYTGHGVPYPLPPTVWHLKTERWHYYKQSKLLQFSCPESGCPLLCVYWSCGGTVGIVTTLQTGRWRNCGLFLAGASGFPQTCSQWLLGIPSLMFSRDWWLFLQGQNSQDVKLTTHLSWIPRLRVGGTILCFPHVQSGLAHGQLHLYLHVYLLYMSLHTV